MARSTPLVCPKLGRYRGTVPAIDVQSLTIRFDEAVAVNNVSFTVARGEVVALLGPNGAGKTTTMETIEGYRTPDQGSILVFGQNPRTQRRQLAQRWGVMPQTGGLPMGLTVGEAVKLFANLHDYSDSTDDLLQAAGLMELTKQRWRKLSGGEQQRLSLTLALCGGRELLLLDEPTAAVDARGRERILGIIRERAASGAGVLVTTHRFDDVEQIADRVIILDNGVIVGSGSLDELTSNPDSIQFTADIGLATVELSQTLGHRVVEGTPGSYVVDSLPTPELIATLTGWLAKEGHSLGQLSAGRQDLEDVFLRLTGDKNERRDTQS